MDKEVRDILEEPFDPKDIGKDYGKNDYVKPHLIIRRLNKAFGQDGWQFVPEERIVEHDTIIQFGKLGVKDESGEWIWKHNCGARRCEYRKNPPDKRLDVGNDYKSAVSNCIKRCAMMLGIALDLYGDPEHSSGTGASGNSNQQPEDPKAAILASVQRGEIALAAKLGGEISDIRLAHFSNADDPSGYDAGKLKEYDTYMGKAWDAGTLRTGQEPPPKDRSGSTSSDEPDQQAEALKAIRECEIYLDGKDYKIMDLRKESLGTTALGNAGLDAMQKYVKNLQALCDVEKISKDVDDDTTGAEKG